MRALLILAAWAAGAAPCLAENPRGLDLISSPQTASTAISEDPLTRQIRRRKLTQPNGGIRAVVRIASGQSIELKIVDLDLPSVAELRDAPSSGSSQGSLKGPIPAEGLGPQERWEASKRSRALRKAAEQLEKLHEQGLRQARSPAPSAPDF